MRYDHIFFCHIPKTAGTSLWAGCKKVFPPDKVLFGKHSYDLCMMSEEELNKYVYIHGHYYLSLANKIRKPCFRFVFVRNPIDRIISLYNFWRLNYMINQNSWNAGDGPYQAGTQSFCEFLKDNNNHIEIRDAQARYICGNSTNLDFNYVTEDAIRHMINCLEFVGISERFTNSVDILNFKLGEKLYSRDARHNETSRVIMRGNYVDRLRKEELKEHEITLLKEVTALDELVYRCAVDRFERDLNINRNFI